MSTVDPSYCGYCGILGGHSIGCPSSPVTTFQMTTPSPQEQAQCPRCGGHGSVWGQDPCSVCHGTGKVPSEGSIHVRHCYQGEYACSCKYGEDDCPMSPTSQVSVPASPTDSPMGVSQWKAHGVKYGYWDYFANEMYLPAPSEPKNPPKEVSGGLKSASNHSSIPSETIPVAGNALYIILRDLAYDSMGRLATTKHDFILDAHAAITELITAHDQARYKAVMGALGDEEEGRDADYEGGDPAYDRNALRAELRTQVKAIFKMEGK